MDSPQPLFALTKISAGIWTPCTDSGAFLWAGRFLCGKCRLCGLPRPEEGTGRLEDHGQGIYRGLRLRPSIGKQTFPPCVGAEKSFVLCRPAYTGGREYPQAVTADSGKTRQLDHHLTTSSSQPVPCIVFYVPTSFYNHQKQRRKLCTLHNFRRCIMLFACASQFSDSKGQRFESPGRTKSSIFSDAALFVYGRNNKKALALEKGTAPVKLSYWAQCATASRRNCAQPGTLRS